MGLLHLLNQEIDEELKWKQITGNDVQNNNNNEQQIDIQIKDFQQKIQSMDITNINLQQFLKSNKFKSNGFKYDKKKKSNHKIRILTNNDFILYLYFHFFFFVFFLLIDF